MTTNDLLKRYQKIQEKKSGVATIRMTESSLKLADQIASNYGQSRGSVLSDMVSLGLQMFLDDQDKRRMKTV